MEGKSEGSEMISHRQSKIGRVMEQHRMKLGLSLNELAKRTGVSHTALIHIRDGRNDPRIGTLRKLAKALGIPPSTLVLT